MIKANIDETRQIVHIEVSGYISSREAKDFFNNYKQMTRELRGSKYSLVVEPYIFECEEDDDIKKICMSFFKSGYKRIYLIDSNNYIMDKVSLSKIEERMFNKHVKTIGSISEVR